MYLCACVCFIPAENFPLFFRHSLGIHELLYACVHECGTAHIMLLCYYFQSYEAILKVIVYPIVTLFVSKTPYPLEYIAMQ